MSTISRMIIFISILSACLAFRPLEHAPSIIFMDVIDSIGSARMESGRGNGDSEVQRTMLELLNQLDGFKASNKIKKDTEKNMSLLKMWK
ncbi:26S proteasome regulatory subunit 8 homolog B-like isoform X2 [Capsella rubella]|uniref:26S proteasome regulatory subunit 8 homolog B-like isoform X2 n=1 Tax=Capsella rubella TaxID=81985 RepID=UPI000CD4F1E9|nr:26S proteasome regulatory subunit 8 homolog B-like isoform X2 [Capsella rubella]